MSRCSCGNTTCSCVIKAAPDGGVKITGSGSSQSPYLVSMEASLKDGITVADTQTLDLTVVPQAGGKVQIYGNTLTKVTDLKDVADVEGPQVGDSMVWMGNHWEFRPPTTVAPGVIHTDNGISGDGSLSTPIIAKTSGVFGTAPITTARYAGVQDFGDEIYLDTTGKLRTKPKMLWTNLNGSAAPSAYPNGWSILTVNATNVGGGTGWPGNFFGSVETVKRMETASAQDNGQVQQWFYKNNSGDVFYRWAANDAGGWSPWNLTSAGSVVTSQYHQSSGDIAIAATTDTLINFGTAYMTHPSLPYSAGIWTIQLPGIYQISGSLFFGKPSTGTPRAYASVFINNAPAGQQIRLQNTPNYETIAFVWIKQLAANDNVRIIARNDIATNVLANSTSFQTHCAITRLGN